MTILLVVSLITLPDKGFEEVEQIVLKDKCSSKVSKNEVYRNNWNNVILSDVDNCSKRLRPIGTIYLDINEKKITNLLKDVAQLLSHNDFIYCHSLYIYILG